MTRPFCPRRISCWPEATYFKPAGVPLRVLDEITLALDELEALRLADLNGMYQEKAAQRMKISRPTFARIVEAARRKVADALIHGKALRLEGGIVEMKGDKEMLGRNGKGAGKGHGACGCGQRRERGGRCAMGRARHGIHRAADMAGTAKEEKQS